MPAAARLRSREEFTAVVRTGRRASSATVVVHALANPADSSESPRVGFVVGRAVGGAVLRNRARRRLRHLMRDRLAGLPRAARVVVRALAPAGAAPARVLAADLDRCLAQAMGPPR